MKSIFPACLNLFSPLFSISFRFPSGRRSGSEKFLCIGGIWTPDKVLKMETRTNELMSWNLLFLKCYTWNQQWKTFSVQNLFFPSFRSMWCAVSTTRLADMGIDTRLQFSTTPTVMTPLFILGLLAFVNLRMTPRRLNKSLNLSGRATTSISDKHRHFPFLSLVCIWSSCCSSLSRYHIR